MPTGMYMFTVIEPVYTDHLCIRPYLVVPRIVFLIGFTVLYKILRSLIDPLACTEAPNLITTPKIRSHVHVAGRQTVIYQRSSFFNSHHPELRLCQSQPWSGLNSWFPLYSDSMT